MPSSVITEEATPCRLPNELLLIIKECIPVHDLRTHVCYYQTCRTIALFYGDSGQQADFWRRSCCLAGIGWLRADSSWKDIAFETIAKDGFCSHPSCGGALLDWNATQVANAMKLYEWDPEEGPWDALCPQDHAPEWEGPNCPDPVCNHIFRVLKFKSEGLPPWFSDVYDPTIRYEGTSVKRLAQRPALSSHPIAARSLATFPSVRMMRFYYSGTTWGDSSRNVLGVTVWDVMRTLQADMDQALTVQQLSDLIKGPFADIFSENKFSNFIQDLSLFSTLRGLWSVTSWEGLGFVRSDAAGPVFISSFSLLPEEHNKRRIELGLAKLELDETEYNTAGGSF